jgi:hypothetical protein
MSRHLTRVCLAPPTVDGPLFVRLIEDHDLGFTPATLVASETRRRRFDARGLRELAATPELAWARVEGRDGGELSLTGIAGHAVAQLIWSGDGVGHDGLVDAVAELPGFHAAYRGDADDAYWQSETSIEAYESAGRAHAHLPKVAGGFFPGEDEQVDVSANPGRATPYDGILLWAASRMWFGAKAFEHLDRERLLALPVGEVVERAGACIVTVDLFPLDWMGSRLDDVRGRQRAFREWMGFDALEERADEVAAADLDPTLEILTGTFEHGGVRLLTEWLDESGVRPAPKSRARSSRTVELSDEGRVLWRGESGLGLSTSRVERTSLGGVPPEVS